MQEKTLLDWSANWQDDQIDVINKLRYAIQHDNYGDMMRLISQLEGLTKKRFTALNNVIKRVSDPNRVLADVKSTEASVAVEEKESAIINNNNLIEKIVFDYKNGKSLKEIAAFNGMKTHKVIKILVTAGVYISDTYDKIKKLREEGETEEGIAYIMGIKESTLNLYTPYTKGIYSDPMRCQDAKRAKTLAELNRQIKKDPSS